MIKFLSGLCIVVAGFSGCASGPKAGEVPPTLPRFFLESSDSHAIPVVLPQSGVRLAINPKPVFVEGDVTNVELMQVELGKCLLFQMTTSAARDLYRLSASNQGRRLVLFVNGEPRGVRRLDGALGDGRLFIFLEMSETELPKLVDDLQRSGLVVQRELARK